jgi:hypothetical protein
LPIAFIAKDDHTLKSFLGTIVCVTPVHQFEQPFSEEQIKVVYLCSGILDGVVYGHVVVYWSNIRIPFYQTSACYNRCIPVSANTRFAVSDRVNISLRCS